MDHHQIRLLVLPGLVLWEPCGPMDHSTTPINESWAPFGKVITIEESRVGLASRQTVSFLPEKLKTSVHFLSA